MSHTSENLSHNRRWYAVTARSRHEKVAAGMLEAQGIAHFLPLTTELRQWSDRKQLVNLPLFPGYLFVHMDLQRESTLPVLKAPGITGLVRNQTGPLPIPEHQIEDIRKVLAEGADCSPHPFLQEGDRVRVLHGALKGLEGNLVRINSEAKLVISIDMIQRSIAVTISRDSVELVDAAAEGELYLAEPSVIVASALDQTGASGKQAFLAG